MGNYCCQDNTVHDGTSSTQIKLSRLPSKGKSTMLKHDSKELVVSTIDKFFVVGDSHNPEKDCASQQTTVVATTEQISNGVSNGHSKPKELEIESPIKTDLHLSLEGFHKRIFSNNGYYEGDWHNNKQ